MIIDKKTKLEVQKKKPIQNIIADIKAIVGEGVPIKIDEDYIEIKAILTAIQKQNILNLL